MPPNPVAPGGQDKARIFGIIGIVTAICCTGVLGIIFGALSVREAKRTGTSAVLGWIAIVLGVLGLCKDVWVIRYGPFSNQKM
ncbi:hypothetical protein [Catellatospora sp. KI3]|uniref:hypothetical protein n=1 Tax=Catellatospora sp. KI3 TaxID=3041620 RepID=UPI0032B12A83